MNDHPWRQASMFLVVAAVLLSAVGFLMAESRFDDQNEYAAVFSDINGLKNGDDVRASGVTVGKVTGLDLRDDDTVLVRFKAASRVQMYASSRAAVRYQSLTGTKYLELARGEESAPLSAEGTLPVTQTDPGLDLDAVFNSFQPLVRGLSPEQVNKLSASVIEVFQGQAGSITSLLADLAQLTTTLADRSDVVDALIVNMQQVLGTVDDQRGALDTTVRNLRKLVSGLARDRNRIVDSFAAVSDLANEGSAFLAALRPEFQDNLVAIRSFTGAFNSDLATVDHYLAGMATAVKTVSRLGAYGSFYNLYLCGLTVQLSTPVGTIRTPDLRDQSPRCQLDGEN